MKTWKRNSNGANSSCPSAKDQINNKKFIKRLKNKEPGAFDEFVRLYKPMLEQICQYNCRGNDSHIDDMIQISLIQIYRKLHQFRGESLFTSWLFKVVLNEVRAYIRKHNSQTYSLVLGSSDDEIEQLLEKNNPHHANLDDYVDAKRFLAKIANNKMGKPELDAVKASVHFDTCAQCAAALNITVPAFKSRLYRGLQKLNKDYYEYNKRSSMELYCEALDERKLAGNQ